MFKIVQSITNAAKNVPINIRRCPKRPTVRRCFSTKDHPSGAVISGEALSIPSVLVGQPTCHTHPHLIPPGQLVCGVTQSEFRDRRTTLVSRLEAELPNTNRHHIVVIPAANKQYMSDKIPYVFRQHSDFYYLTGCLEPNAVLVLVKSRHNDNYKSILFLSEKDSHAELWEGPRTGCSVATQLFAVDEARPVDTVQTFLEKIVSTSKPAVLWYCRSSPANPDMHQKIQTVVKSDASVTLADPQSTLHAMRLIKSSAEIQLMQDTCQVGAHAINMAVACTKPGITEHTVNAILDYSCRTAGAEHLAFPPVVAGGARATHIHYVSNNQVLAGDEMLLVDSGCQRWMYNSDISRTWPVSGKFSRYHLVLYEVVLAVQKRLIELLAEQRPPLDHLFDSMCRLLGRHLQEAGILRKDIEGNELITRAYRLCPHHVSHYLGLDVHDTPLVRRSAPVRSGMVVTVEPGVYIAADDMSVPREFRGAGVRVEDDVLVTDGAPVLLSAAAVKEVRDIEALVGTQAGS